MKQLSKFILGWVLLVAPFLANSQVLPKSLYTTRNAWYDGNIELCLVMVDKRIEQDSITPYHYYIKSMCSYASEDIEVGNKYARKTLGILGKTDTLWEDVYYGIAYAKAYELNWDSAMHYIDIIKEINPHNADAYLLQSSIYDQMKMPDSVIAELTRGVKNANRIRDLLYNNLSYHLTQEGRFVEAISAANLGLEIATDTFWIGSLTNNKGFAVGMNADPYLGLEIIDSSFESLAKNPYAHYNKALLYMELGDLDNMCQQLQKCEYHGGAFNSFDLQQKHCK